MINLGNSLTILLIAGYNGPVPDVLGGGAERLVTMLADQNEIENQVELLIVSPYNKQAKMASQRYINTKFIYLKKGTIVDKIHNVIVRIINKIFHMHFSKWGYYRNILKRIDFSLIDIVVDENGYVPEIKYISDAINKKRVLAHIHWNVNPVERKIDRLYGGVIGVSAYVADSWTSVSSDEELKKMVVYSAVDEYRFDKNREDKNRSTTREKYKIGEDKIVYIYCGRLSSQKGTDILIEAFKTIANPNIVLLIVGGSYLSNSKASEYEKTLWKMAEEDSRIIFTGYVSNDELYSYYQAADVQVIPTIVEEAAGLVAIEGMIIGLPIIATNSGGLPEYISGGGAIIVDKGDELCTHLRNALTVLAQDNELRKTMSEEAKKRAKFFSSVKYYNDFVECVKAYIEEQKK